MDKSNSDIKSVATDNIDNALKESAKEAASFSANAAKIFERRMKQLLDLGGPKAKQAVFKCCEIMLAATTPIQVAAKGLHCVVGALNDLKKLAGGESPSTSRIRKTAGALAITALISGTQSGLAHFMGPELSSNLEAEASAFIKAFHGVDSPVQKIALNNVLETSANASTGHRFNPFDREYENASNGNAPVLNISNQHHLYTPSGLGDDAMPVEENVAALYSYYKSLALSSDNHAPLDAIDTLCGDGSMEKDQTSTLAALIMVKASGVEQHSMEALVHNISVASEKFEQLGLEEAPTLEMSVLLAHMDKSPEHYELNGVSQYDVMGLSYSLRDGVRSLSDEQITKIISDFAAEDYIYMASESLYVHVDDLSDFTPSDGSQSLMEKVVNFVDSPSLGSFDGSFNQGAGNRDQAEGMILEALRREKMARLSFTHQVEAVDDLFNERNIEITSIIKTNEERNEQVINPDVHPDANALFESFSQPADTVITTKNESSKSPSV